MNMKRIFKRLHHADDAALREMGAFPVIERTEQEALFAKCEQKYRAAQTDASDPVESVPAPVIEQTHSRWKPAACAAACLAVCAAAAGGIAFLYRAAPGQAPMQQAELPAATAAVPEGTQAVPAVTAETNAAAADVTAETVFRETKAAPVEDVTEAAENVAETAVQAEPETQSAPAMQQSAAATAEEVPAVTEAPTEAAAEWLSYEDEVTLPGFRIEKTGENWLISAEQEHVSFEQLYELQFLPEGAVCIGSDTAEATVTSGFRGHDVYYRTEDADYAFMQYGRIEPSVNFVAAGNEGTAYTSLKPVTVAGHDGYLLVFRQCQEQTMTEYQLGWLPGDRFCLIDACTLTEEDLTDTILQMAESAVLTE
ncbi:MAG: hypothetical protein K5695_01235 [Oscillospiraceae bacterium]|nr:hypothetical protein [Oscillospiraceae bacterium]